MSVLMANIYPEIATFSSTEACRLAGITYRQIDYYDRTGLLGKPKPARGSGTQRRWTTREVDALRVVGRVMALRTDRGMTHRVRDLAAYVQEHGATGKFELIPGVIVDLDALQAA